MPLCPIILIGAVVVAPLDEARTHSFAAGATQSQPVAQFNEVLSSENVFIIGASPNKEQRLNPNWPHRPIYERNGGRNIDYCARLNRLRSEEEWRWGVL
jgi:hypothetical protein